MARLKIRRTNQYLNRYRSYQIFIDGERAGSIPNGETGSFEINGGKHRIFAQTGFGKSSEILIDIDENEGKELKLGGFKNANVVVPVIAAIFILNCLLIYLVGFEFGKIINWLLILIILFFIGFGRNRYLTLKEIRKI